MAATTTEEQKLELENALLSHKDDVPGVLHVVLVAFSPPLRSRSSNLTNDGTHRAGVSSLPKERTKGMDFGCTVVFKDREAMHVRDVPYGHYRETPCIPGWILSPYAALELRRCVLCSVARVNVVFVRQLLGSRFHVTVVEGHRAEHVREVVRVGRGMFAWLAFEHLATFKFDVSRV